MKTPLYTGDGELPRDFVDFKKFFSLVISTFDNRPFFGLYVKRPFEVALIHHPFYAVFFSVFVGRLYHTIGAEVSRKVNANQLDTSVENGVCYMGGGIERCENRLYTFYQVFRRQELTRVSRVDGELPVFAHIFTAIHFY